MRRWNIRAVLSAACARPAIQPRPAAASYFGRLATTHASNDERHHPPPPASRRSSIFDKVGRPERQIDAWLALLEGALPPHLRDWSNDASPPTLSAVEVADILLEAQRPRSPADEPFDLLFYLGITKGRWNAVVWLIKKLVEKFPVRHNRASRLSKANAIWDKAPFLDNLVKSPVELSPPTVDSNANKLELRSLDELTHGAPDNLSAEELLGHDALGQIWRTLGAMTKACVGEDIRPEVLEIIAFLHHREVMPMSIYQAERHPDSSAIQQPPLLSLLSSRILTSLSDAAWRAHEKLVVEEAKAMGGEYADLRPEIPGSVYRVHVAGLLPEVWMELILWSCLRGGWLLPGADILQSIIQDTSWKPISWQDYERAMPAAADRSDSTTWSNWGYVFKTRRPSTRESPAESSTPVVKTVSAELVNAYVDALATTVTTGIPSRGVDIVDVLPRLHRLKDFVTKRGYRLTLSFGTWDALVLRLIESQGVVPEEDSGTIQQLVQLSRGFSQGLKASNAQGLPAYVLDGNMAMHGLLHLALKGQIATGSFEGALAIFNHLQKRTDASRRISLEDFIGRVHGEHRTKAQSRALSIDEMFTSNFAGIEYPGHKMQIPIPTLAQLLDLATDVKAYDFGHYLLHNDDVDGPFISQDLYDDRYIQPAVIRFAVESNDQVLLAKFKELRLNRDTFRAMLDTQVKNLKWDAANRVLDYLTETQSTSWSVFNLANLTQTMLLQHSKVLAGDTGAKKDLESAIKLFEDMTRGHYAEAWETRGSKSRGVRNLATVLLAVDRRWAALCTIIFQRTARGYRTFDLNARSFNAVLEGAVTAYGTVKGKYLLNTFWPDAVREMRVAALRLGRFTERRGKIAGARFTPSESFKDQRIVVSVPGASVEKEELVVYGGLVPNTQTIMILLRRALDELALESAESTSSVKNRDIVKWAVHRLAELPYVEASITEQLRETLVNRGLNDIVAELPKIVRFAEDELLSGFDDSTGPIDDEPLASSDSVQSAPPGDAQTDASSDSGQAVTPTQS